MKTRLRIGIDACCWGNKRGFGRFTRELLTALLAEDAGRDYYFFIDSATAKHCSFPANARVVAVETDVAPTDAASGSGRRSLKDLWAMSRAVAKQPLDLFFFPAVYSYFPILNRCKVVVTIHDLIADNHPDLVFSNARLKLFWKLKQNIAVWQSHGIQTVSEFSKRSISGFFRLPESKIRVIPEGPGAAFHPLPSGGTRDAALDKYGIGRGSRFLLHVGGFSPHKNLGALVEAWAQLIRDEKFRDVGLVFAGDYETDSFFSGHATLTRQIEKLGLREKVTFTGFAPDDDLTHLYNAASALVFPSLEEGFGLPLIEAMSCGTPVICSNRGSLPEIAGEAGLCFDPTRPDELGGLLSRVLGDNAVAEKLSLAGLARAQQFTWKNAARKTLACFDAILPRAES